MLIGSRWKTGTEAPGSLSSDMRDALGQAELTLRDDFTTHALDQMFWTLTWLEGRPVCSHESGVEVTTGPSGVVNIRHRDHDAFDSNDDTDDWLTS